MGLGGTSIVYAGYLDLIVFKVILAAFGVHVTKIAWKLRTTGHRVKRIEKWDSVKLV